MADTEEKIQCPKCAWEPDGGSYWQCHCGHLWNTFDTYGKCPACGKVHKDTQCISCHKWSPHADWYITLMGKDLNLEEVMEVEQSQENE